jgi:inner membrane transporter RhtA
VTGERVPAAALVATGAVSVQIGAALATHLFHRVGPDGAVALRLTLAAVAMVILSRPGRSTLAGLRRGDNAAVAVAFGLALAGMNFTFYQAIARIPLGVAVTVEFAGPLALTIALSRRRTDVVWVLLAGAGVFLLASGGLLGTVRHLDLAGVWLALAAGGLWACYILLSRETGRRFSGTSGLTVAMAVAAVAVLPSGIVQAGSHLLDPPALGLGLAVAMLSSAVPYSFELIALRRVTPRAFGILLSMEPGIAALAGLAILDQHLSAIEVAALALVMAANVGSSWADARTVRPAAAEPTA